MSRQTRRRFLTTIGATSALGAASGLAGGQGRGRGGADLIAPLTHGESENPTLERTGASGFATLSVDGETIDYTVTARNIQNLTQAHIHGPAGRGETAGVLAFLVRFADGVGGPASDAESSGPGDPIVEEGTVQNSQLATAISEEPGQYYVNVHTVRNPAGEIRGQIR